MTDQGEVVIGRWPDQPLSVRKGLAGLLAAYHLQTEAEKGAAVADADGLPDRYRAEIRGPRSPTTSCSWH